MNSQEMAIRQILMFLTWVRVSDAQGALRRYSRADGYLLGLYSAGLITGQQWMQLCDLARNSLDYSGQPFLGSLLIGELSPMSAGPLSSLGFSSVPAPADALPSPAVGPELPELEQVPALPEVVAHVEPLQVLTPAPRRELWLLCVLVGSPALAMGFRTGRGKFQPVATVRRLPPFVDSMGRWGYDPNGWQVCRNRLYLPLATPGLYLRQTPALSYREVQQRLQRRFASCSASQVLAANQQCGQAGAVCTDGHNARSFRSGVAS